MESRSLSRRIVVYRGSGVVGFFQQQVFQVVRLQSAISDLSPLGIGVD
jgi:hypothetical protein